MNLKRIWKTKFNQKNIKLKRNIRHNIKIDILMVKILSNMIKLIIIKRIIQMTLTMNLITIVCLRMEIIIEVTTNKNHKEEN